MSELNGMDLVTSVMEQIQTITQNLGYLPRAVVQYPPWLSRDLDQDYPVLCITVRERLLQIHGVTSVEEGCVAGLTVVYDPNGRA